MNFYKRYTGDYARDTVHLTMIEDGAYNRLIDFYYSTEKPLPSDRKAVYRIARATDKAEQKAVDNVLSQFFQNESDGHHHKRIDAEIEKAKPKADANRENGKKGGRPSKKQPTGNPEENPLGSGGGTQEEPTGNPLGSENETQTEPTTEPTLVNHSHSHKNIKEAKPDGFGADAPQLIPADALFQVAVPWLVARDVPDKTARSLLGGARKQLGDDAAWAVASECIRIAPLDPVPWLAAAINARLGKKPTKLSGQTLDNEAENAKAYALLFGEQPTEVLDGAS